MNDSQDTVLIIGLRGDFDGMEFIKTFGKFGEIKTDRETGQRLAEMKPVLDGSEKEGIVTYADQHSATKVIKELNGTEIGGRRISVSAPDSYFYGRMPRDRNDPKEFANMAWRLWKEEGLRKDGGGRGGKGGGVYSSGGILSYFGFGGKRGNDGEAGSSGGKGGKGGTSGH